MPRKIKTLARTTESSSVLSEGTSPLVPGRLYTSEAVCLFAFAGRAYLTVRSARTGTRFTYKIRQGKNPRFLNVSVLTGPENSTDYSYFGFYVDGEYHHARSRAALAPSAPAVVAFEYLSRVLRRPGRLPEVLEVYHDGRCGACARRLTVPESILTGFGPECSDRLGITRISCDDPLAEILAA